MNRRNPSAASHATRFFCWVLAAMLFSTLVGFAQQEPRWLLIFENSSAMKKRMPAAEKSLQQLLFTSVGGQMHAGDSLGVWTFDQTLHVGEFPLSTWKPEAATTTFSNLTAFLKKRSFKGEVNFNALEPRLSRLVTDSQRLTILIFCEGQGDIIWTPYNNGINQALRTGYDERKKSNQPFIITLRAQDGKYCGCSVNFPPSELNLPPFPEPVEETPPAPVAEKKFEVAENRAKAALDSAPLFIVGTNVGTNLAALPPPPPKPDPIVHPTAPEVVTSNTLSISNTVAASNQPSLGAVTADSTNQTSGLAAQNSGAAGGAATNPSTNSAKAGQDTGYRLLVWTGTLAIVSAIALIIYLIGRTRQPNGSLITDSMSAPHRSPRK